MLRLLSIRNFAVVEALEIEFEPGFTVLTGETGAGKSILLDALSLLLGGRFESRQLRSGSERAEIAAEFDLADASGLRAWLGEQDLADDGPLLLRRTLDAQGRSRAWINGRPATLQQLGEAELIESESALNLRLAALIHQLRRAATHDRSLEPVVALADEALVRVDEAGRTLRNYRERLDLDPAELARIEERLAAIHAVARKHRVAPEALPALAQETDRRLAALVADADTEALARAERETLAAYRSLASELTAKRKFAAVELAHRVSATMKELAMGSGRFDVALSPVVEPASFGMESVEFRVATHPKQPLGAIARVASGGELSRLALAIQFALADVGQVPTLIFDEVDVGIGGAVAATVGRLLGQLGARRQVLCVTHL